MRAATPLGRVFQGTQLAIPSSRGGLGAPQRTHLRQHSVVSCAVRAHHRSAGKQYRRLGAASAEHHAAHDQDDAHERQREHHDCGVGRVAAAAATILGRLLASAHAPLVFVSHGVAGCMHGMQL